MLAKGGLGERHAWRRQHTKIAERNVFLQKSFYFFYYVRTAGCDISVDKLHMSFPGACFDWRV